MEYVRTPSIPENLRFVSIEEIETVRRAQELAIVEAGAEALAGLEVSEVFDRGIELRDVAQEQLKNEIDEAAELYVADHLSREDNEELFDGCVDLVKRYSILNMSDSEWRAGVQNADGDYDQPETSGQRRLWHELLVLEREEDIDDDPADPPVPEDLTPLHDDAEVVRLAGNLQTSRSALAAISIKRRALLSKGASKKAKALSDEYDAAQAAYNQAQLEIGAMSVDALRASGVADDEIKVQVVAGTLAERAAFTQAEADAMAEDNSRMGKFVRWYSKTTKRMVGINLAVGVTTGYALGKFVKYGLLAAVPGVGFGALVGLRAGKSMLTAGVAGRARLHREFEQRGTADSAALRDQLIEESRGISGTDTAELATFAARNIQNSVDNRITKDIKGNVKRVAISTAVAGSAAVVGALAADHIHWPGSGSGAGHEAATTGQTPDQILKDAGVGADMRQKILDNPEQFDKFLNSVAHIKTETGLTGDALNQRVADALSLAHHLENAPAVSGGGIDLTVDLPEAFGLSGETFAIGHGGGIIRDVIHPFALEHGHNLTPTQESQVWQAVRAKFGDDIFTNLPVGAHSADQWILQPGTGTLRPEVTAYMTQQIAVVK